MKKILIICLSMLMAAASMVGCTSTSENTAIASNTNSTQDTVSVKSDTVSATDVDADSFEAVFDEALDDISYEYSNADQEASYTADESVYIDLDNMTSDDNGVFTADNVITINRAGTYILSGTLSDGQIFVDATKVDIVRLVLDNATIHNNSGSAILVNQAEKVVITLAYDSQNSVSDGSNYLDTADGSPDAAIYANDDLTINGNGSLTVTGSYLHGIKTKDDLVIMSGDIKVTAVEEGLKGKDSVVIADGNIDVTSSGDGIKTDNDEEKGYIIIDGGNITIDSVFNGIESQNGIIINDGVFNITSQQDGIHSNGSIRVIGGDITMDVADDGIHSDNVLEILGGNIDILNSYEGLEGAYYTQLGGMINIVASDDGINAAGGSTDTTLAMDMPVPESLDEGDANNRFANEPIPEDDAMVNGRPDDGQMPEDDAMMNDRFAKNPMAEGDMMVDDRFAEQAIGDYLIYIGDGYTHMVVGGDGLDSNGNITITGGTLIIDGAVTELGDPAIDAHSEVNFLYTGGTLVAVGCDSMFIEATTVDQPVVAVMLGTLMNTDEYISLVDEDGNALFTFIPQQGIETIMLSSSELELGESYSLVTGGSYDGETVDGTYYTGSQLIGGEVLFDFELNDTMTTLDANGDLTDTANYGTQPGGGMGQNTRQRP